MIIIIQQQAVITWHFSGQSKNEKTIHYKEKQIYMQDWKIKVLMIYYDHWGKDEIRARKALNGLQKTIRQLEEWFPMEEEELLVKRLKRIFLYDMDLLDRWKEFTEVLLGEALSFVHEDDFLEDEDDILFERKVMFEDRLNIFNEETSDLIYDDGFQYENILSVDAIVALM